MSKATIMSPPDSNRVIHHTEAGAVTADDVVLATGRVLVAYSDIDASVEGMYYHQVDELEHAKAAVAIAALETAYWDDVAKVFTNVVTANTKCGMFRKSALIGDATANVRLDNTVNL